MTKLLFRVNSFARMAALTAMVAFFVSACSDEKKESLPELPSVEIPKDIAGLYSGRMPCDDCAADMIRMTLGEDSTVKVVRKVIKDSVTADTDTLLGTYTVVDSMVKVSLSNDSIHWNYQRDAMGNLSYVTSAGSVYKDENGMRMELIHIFKTPVKAKAE